MAYIDFATDPMLAGPSGGPRHDLVSTPQASLSALEWTVVALAKRDSLASLARPARLSVALGTVFGGPRSNPSLADPKLEALRRMAVLIWHKAVAVPASELNAFLAAGFSAAQHETLRASISAARPRQEVRA